MRKILSRFGIAVVNKRRLVIYPIDTSDPDLSVGSLVKSEDVKTGDAVELYSLVGTYLVEDGDAKRYDEMFEEEAGGSDRKVRWD